MASSASRALTTFVPLAMTLTFAPTVRAEPQITAGLTPGLCGRTSDTTSGLCFYGAARGELLLWRERATDFGLGPAVEVGTAAFDDFRASAGLSLLVPMDSFPLVLTAAPFVSAGDEFDYGPSIRVFWGLRAYNHLSTYSAAGGIIAGVDYGIGARGEQTWTLALQLDAMWLALPVLALYSWARGPSN